MGKLLIFKGVILVYIIYWWYIINGWNDCKYERCQETSKFKYLKNKLHKIKYMNYNFGRDMQRDVTHVRIKAKEMARRN